MIGHLCSVQPDSGREPRSPLRILHVDDEADIREIVDIALGLDPSLSLHGCASGAEALKAAANWHPDLILLDVMMPGMDGPTTLANLRENTETADIPVVFMTARAQTRELDHFLSLGAVGVITKPFDPMTLSASVRNHSQAARLAAPRNAFVLRMSRDAAMLAAQRPLLSSRATLTEALEHIRGIAHRLSGAAGIYGFADISIAASALEQNVVAEREADSPRAVINTLERLLALLASPVARAKKSSNQPAEPDGTQS